MKKRVAVIGSGIAGLVSGWLCREEGAEVTIIEARSKRGMDSQTQYITIDGVTNGYVDVPLRVLSPQGWPTVLKICEKLNVNTFEVDTDVACSWINSNTWFRSKKVKIGSRIFPFAPLNYILRKETYKILFGFIKLYMAKPELLNSGLTLKEFAKKQPMDPLFWKGLIYPLLKTICTSDEKTLDCWPAKQILVLLQKIVFGSRLRRIKGGTKALAEKLGKGQNWKYDTFVEKLVEDSKGIYLNSKKSQLGPFDYVICATQANQLNFLPEKYNHEKTILNSFPYSSGNLWVHRDIRFMPTKREDWSPIHYQIEKNLSRSMFSVWVNPIEPSISSHEPVLQTWNPLFEPKSEKVISTVPMERAVVSNFNQNLIDELDKLNKLPSRKVYFCGSYASPGVPLLESAVCSAIKIIKLIGFNSKNIIDLRGNY